MSTNELNSTQTAVAPSTQELEEVTIRFAGDSGDGMQLTGSRFTLESAFLGNDLATQPDFPAEIRAPAGSLPGVSAFQIRIGKIKISTAGDDLDVLIAMNPAALKTNLPDLRQNGILICNSDAFSDNNIRKAKYEENPLEDESLASKYTLVQCPITTLTHEAITEFGLSKKIGDRCKNFFALGIVCWLYSRHIDNTIKWLDNKFAKLPEIAGANKAALLGGMAFAQASELFPSNYSVPEADLAPGTYRNIMGNTGIAYGLIAASQLSGMPLFYGSYPITPASDILHDVARYKNFGAVTFQAEDEIAACCSAIGASFGGMLGVTTSSGPGIALKQEAIGYAMITELPLVIVNVQRSGPSTGMPTKTEQSDLLEVLYGRNGESPVIVVAISSPADAFEATIEACRLAVETRTPVFLLSDGSIANGSQPWKLPDIESLVPIDPNFTTKASDDFKAYNRDPETKIRNWALPGTKGLEHRVGGIEKADITGNVSYDPENHHHMSLVRAEKVKQVANRLPPTEVVGPESGDLLVIGWGGTHGSLSAATELAREKGLAVSHVHLRYLNPLPNDLGDIISRFKHVLIPELNLGQLSQIIRSRYMIDAIGYNRLTGQPFKVRTILAKIEEILG